MTRLAWGAAITAAAFVCHSALAQPAIEEIVVTASPLSRTQQDLAQGATVIGGDALKDRSGRTLGETLQGLPGVSSTFFGPQASRPIIRGLGGDRIRVLENGIGVIDASSASADHQTVSETAGADRIEILRGPATLRYGSSAVGGVVNVIDDRIAREPPGKAMSGTFDAGYGSNADEGDASGSVTFAANSLVARFDGAYRNTEDYKTGGAAIGNSDGRHHDFGGGLSYVGDRGFLGVAASRYDSNYGSPAEEDVRIDLKRSQYDLEGGASFDGLIESVSARAGGGNYRHTELEDGTAGTVFTNDGWEGRIEAIHRPIGNLRGAVGLQVRKRDFAAIGEEAFVAPSTTRQPALFVVEAFELGRVLLEAGARYERTRIGTDAGDRRTFGTVSWSTSATWRLPQDYALALTGSQSSRAPTAEELFSNGPHLATGQFEIGDATLGRERATHLEFSLSRDKGPVTGAVNVFATWYDDFIQEQLTGAVEDDLPVFAFQQSDAKFIGAEAETKIALYDTSDAKLGLDGSISYVRATRSAPDEPLPRIPPLSYTLALAGSSGIWAGRVEVAGAVRQDRLGFGETETPGYTFLNAQVSVAPFKERPVRFVLQGRNLTDAVGRQHASFLKDVAPLPGRDIRFGIQTAF